ncbi:hypothetical protein MKW92_046756 [Papaver armeniacum]|nr:hypothetical protein MKW92_046756 [Papaver armeniacum]
MEEQATNLSNIFDNNSMHQILSYLPVKTLMKFKCVSKSWESLTRDPSFIKLHRSKAPLQILIMIYKGDSIEVYAPKNDFQGGEAICKATIPWGGLVIPKPVNGLFCFINSKRSVSRVYNLATQQSTPWISIPVPSVTELAHATATKLPKYDFGFDPSTGQHKVLCTWAISKIGVMTSGKVDHICQVFTLGENLKIDQVPPVRPDGVSVYANGSIYRRNRNDNFFKPPDIELIVAFDVGTEKFRVIPIPDFVTGSPEAPDYSRRRDKQLLLEVDGHIALIDRLSENAVKLWISDDDYMLKKTDVKWVEETIILPFPWPSGKCLYFRAVEGTKQMIIYKAPEARGFVTIYIYDRVTKNFRAIEIVGLPRLPSPFLYGMFATHENLLPLQNKETNED